MILLSFRVRGFYFIFSTRFFDKRKHKIILSHISVHPKKILRFCTVAEMSRIFSFSCFNPFHTAKKYIKLFSAQFNDFVHHQDTFWIEELFVRIWNVKCFSKDFFIRCMIFEKIRTLRSTLKCENKTISYPTDQKNN